MWIRRKKEWWARDEEKGRPMDEEINTMQEWGQVKEEKEKQRLCLMGSKKGKRRNLDEENDDIEN